MSVSVAAYAIVGVPIDPRDLYYNRSVSVHENCTERGSGAFCSSCGRSMGTVKIITTLLEGYDPEGGKDYGGLFRGLEIVKAYWGGEARCFLAATYVKDNTDGFGATGGPQKIPPFDFAELRERVQKILEPIGLWRSDDFGVWVAADSS